MRHCVAWINKCLNLIFVGAVLERVRHDFTDENSLGGWWDILTVIGAKKHFGAWDLLWVETDERWWPTIKRMLARRHSNAMIRWDHRLSVWATKWPNTWDETKLCETESNAVFASDVINKVSNSLWNFFLGTCNKVYYYVHTLHSSYFASCRSALT